ncbi:MAG: BTAD domain-containing putative transcriptional regulator [Acidimicrobiales bacterium]
MVPASSRPDAGPVVELRLLGGFGLTVAGGPVDMTPAAQRLLAFVALTPRGADRTFTAFQLWPEHSEHRAKANLRSALWRLGKAPAELVSATKSHLRLSERVWVDVRHGLADMAATGMTSILDTALPFDTLDHDLLPDWYDDWLTIERERLRQLRLGSLEEGARLALGQDRPAVAVQLALTAVAVDPLRESAHRLVIDAHLANGNRLDARRQFDAYRSMVVSRLGCEPSAELADLIERALGGDAPPVLAAA